MFEQLKPDSEEYKRLTALYDQWVDIKQAQEEYFHQWAEYATGVSFSGVVDNFMDALLSGEKNVAQFADNVEELLRNAIIQGFKTRYLMDALEPWYKEFAEFSGDEEGLTKEEIELLRSSIQGIMGDASDAFEALGELGVDLSGAADSANSLKGAFKGLTEETGSILAGRLNSIHLTVNAHLDIARRAVLHQAETAANTRRLENVEYYLRDIKKSLTSGDSSIKTKRAGGM